MQLESNWLPHSRLDTIAPVGSSHLVVRAVVPRATAGFQCVLQPEHAVSSAVTSHRLVEYCTLLWLNILAVCINFR